MESRVRTLKVKRKENPKGVRQIAYLGRLAVQGSCQSKVVVAATAAEQVAATAAEQVAATAAEQKPEVEHSVRWVGTQWRLLHRQGKT